MRYPPHTLQLTLENPFEGAGWRQHRKAQPPLRYRQKAGGPICAGKLLGSGKSATPWNQALLRPLDSMAAILDPSAI